MASFDTMPEEVLMHIFKFVDAYSLREAGKVCKLWNLVASDERLWTKLIQKQLAEHHTLCLHDSSENGNFDSRYYVNNEILPRLLPEVTPCQLYFRKAFLYHQLYTKQALRIDLSQVPQLTLCCKLKFDGAESSRQSISRVADCDCFLHFYTSIRKDTDSHLGQIQVTCYDHVQQQKMTSVGFGCPIDFSDQKTLPKALENSFFQAVENAYEILMLLREVNKVSKELTQDANLKNVSMSELLEDLTLYANPEQHKILLDRFPKTHNSKDYANLNIYFKLIEYTVARIVTLPFNTLTPGTAIVPFVALLSTEVAMDPHISRSYYLYSRLFSVLGIWNFRLGHADNIVRWGWRNKFPLDEPQFKQLEEFVTYLDQHWIKSEALYLNDYEWTLRFPPIDENEDSTQSQNINESDCTELEDKNQNQENLPGTPRVRGQTLCLSLSIQAENSVAIEIKFKG